MSYHNALNYIAQKTSVIELYDQSGGRVAICPEWNGRVLTSTNGGLEGDSFGYVNVQAIETDRCEDLGGENLGTFSPLRYSYSVESIKKHRALLERTHRMADSNGVSVEFHHTREISLLSPFQAGEIFADAVPEGAAAVMEILERSDVVSVGFCVECAVRAQEKAHLAGRQRGMFNASPHTAVIVSAPPVFSPEPFSADVDYLGGAPHGRIRHLDEALLIKADGQGRCQVTMPFANAPPVFGAIERKSGTLTLWSFDLPDDYPGTDDMIRIYNPGRSQGGESDWATYYEMNFFSAVREVSPEHPLEHVQSTLHINADNAILDELIQKIFGLSLESIARTMLW
jgi:hypothetical protein